MKSGLLTGKMTQERVAALPEDDFRRRAPAFQEPQLTRNLALADLMKADRRAPRPVAPEKSPSPGPCATRRSPPPSSACGRPNRRPEWSARWNSAVAGGDRGNRFRAPG